MHRFLFENNGRVLNKTQRRIIALLGIKYVIFAISCKVNETKTALSDLVGIDLFLVVIQLPLPRGQCLPTLRFDKRAW
jgi:hypothetical protein